MYVKEGEGAPARLKLKESFIESELIFNFTFKWGYGCERRARLPV